MSNEEMLSLAEFLNAMEDMDKRDKELEAELVDVLEIKDDSSSAA